MSKAHDRISWQAPPMAGWASLLFGAAGALFFSWCAYGLLAEKTDVPLEARDLAFIEDRLVRAEERGEKSGLTLQLWLESDPIPVRASGAYPGSFREEVLAKMKAGSKLKVGCARAEMEHPRKDRSQDQVFRSIVSLEVDGMQALTLEDFNAWRKENGNLGKKVLSALLLGCVFLIVYGVHAIRKQRSR